MIQTLQGSIIELERQMSLSQTTQTVISESQMTVVGRGPSDPSTFMKLLNTPRVLKKVISYLQEDVGAVLSLSSLDKGSRLALSLASLPAKIVCESKITRLQRELSSVQRTEERFKEITMPGVGSSEEFVQFLLFKYLTKQVKPAVVLEPTLIKSQQLINTINDETSSMLFSESNGKPIDKEDEPDHIEKLKVLTLKQIESVLARQLFSKGEAPDSILKMKKDNYEKVEVGPNLGTEEAADHHADVQSEA